MFGFGKPKKHNNAKVKTQPQLQSQPDTSQPVRPSAIYFSSPIRMVSHLQDDREMQAALIEFRKAYCATYKGMFSEFCGYPYDDSNYEKLDEMLFTGIANLEKSLGVLSRLFNCSGSWKDKESYLYDCTGFEYRPFLEYDGELTTDLEYFYDTILPECEKYGIESKYDLIEDIEHQRIVSKQYRFDRTTRQIKQIKPLGYFGPVLYPSELIDFMGKMKQELLHGTFPTVHRTGEDRASRLYFDTGYSIPSLINSFSHLVRQATPGSKQKICFNDSEVDSVLYSRFAGKYKYTSFISCQENPADEGYPVAPIRKIIIDIHKAYSNDVEQIVLNPQTFEQDCRNVVKSIVLRNESYYNRLNTVIVDEYGKDGELRGVYEDANFQRPVEDLNKLLEGHLIEETELKQICER